MTKQVIAVTVDTETRWLAGPFDSVEEASDWMDEHDALMSSLAEDFADEFAFLDEDGTNITDVDVVIMAINEPEEVG